MNTTILPTPGIKIGRLTTTGNYRIDIHSNNRKIMKYEYICDCGTVKYINPHDVNRTREKRVKSCGCLGKEYNENKQKNLVGQRFDRLLVIEKLPWRDNRSLYLCSCDCGESREVDQKDLIKGRRKSCGCIKRGPKNNDQMIGKRFGRLTVISYDSGLKNNKRFFCKCDCGVEVSINSKLLISNKKICCGCTSSERILNKTLDNHKDMIGMKIGKLTVLEFEERFNGVYYYKCQCECGKFTTVGKSILCCDKIYSCGDCGRFVNGKLTSRKQLELYDLLPKGYNAVLNTNLYGLYPDIYIAQYKLCIEYDCSFFHRDNLQRDTRNTSILLSKGFKVLRVKATNTIPDKESFLTLIEEMVSNNQDYAEIIMPDWESGRTFGEVQEIQRKQKAEAAKCQTN